jgi:hypothetical protein
MRFYDMKKITLIASLLVVFTACQKADIRPRTGCTETTREMQRISVKNNNSSNSDGGGQHALGGSSESTQTVDPNNPVPDPNGGDITDPLRKKDQKDNR